MDFIQEGVQMEVDEDGQHVLVDYGATTAGQEYADTSGRHKVGWVEVAWISIKSGFVDFIMLDTVQGASHGVVTVGVVWLIFKSQNSKRKPLRPPATARLQKKRLAHDE
jgi:hypothetical protein